MCTAEEIFVGLCGGLGHIWLGYKTPKLCSQFYLPLWSKVLIRSSRTPCLLSRDFSHLYPETPKSLSFNWSPPLHCRCTQYCVKTEPAPFLCCVPLMFFFSPVKWWPALLRLISEYYFDINELRFALFSTQLPTCAHIHRDTHTNLSLICC